ncbi:hypothetical protein L0Y47_24300 [Ectopseudomonas composti]
MEQILLSLKVLGLLSSGVFGLLGTIHDFRDHNKRFTKWGKISIAGISLSIFLAVAAQLVESYRSQESAEQAALQALESTKRLESIIFELNRTLQPIESISVFVAELEVPLNEPSLLGYKNRLENGIEKYLTMPRNERYKEENISTPTGKAGKKGDFIPTQVSINSRHALFPQLGDEGLPWSTLNVSRLELEFYANPINPKDFSPFSHGIGDGDLSIDLYNNESLTIDKDIEKKTYHLSGHLKSIKEHWKNNSGKIISLPDLAGAQLFISAGPLGIRNKSDQFLSLRQEFEMKSINLKLGNRDIWIHEENLTKHVNSDGLVYWEYNFPKTVEKIFKTN